MHPPQIFSERSPSLDRNQAYEYLNRINRVCDYIDRNLKEDLTLSELSGVAGFSQYHFHRIFAAMTGETLFCFIWRLRLERAATQLCTNSVSSVTSLAAEWGFSSPAVFSRMFKNRFGCSPTAFRSRNRSQKDSSLSQLLRNSGRDFTAPPGYTGDTQNGNIKIRRRDMKADVKIEKIDKMRVAYVRYIGPYAGDTKLFENLYSRLFAWAGPRGVDTSTTYILYHDDPAVTEENNLRLSVCVPIGSGVEVSGEVCEMEIGGGNYAVGSFEVKSDEFGDAWNYMCGEWLPSSGYQPADSAPFERYGADCETKDGKMKVDICVPVIPMQ